PRRQLARGLPLLQTTQQHPLHRAHFVENVLAQVTGGEHVTRQARSHQTDIRYPSVLKIVEHDLEEPANGFRHRRFGGKSLPALSSQSFMVVLKTQSIEVSFASEAVVERALPDLHDFQERAQ